MSNEKNTFRLDEKATQKVAETVDNLMSPTLRDMLAREGWWKLAHDVKVAQGLAPPAEPTLVNCVASLALKVAADARNTRTIAEGLAAYRRVTEGL